MTHTVTVYELTSEQTKVINRDLMEVYDACEEVAAMLRLLKNALPESEYVLDDELDDAVKILARSIDTLRDVRMKPLDVVHILSKNGKTVTRREARNADHS